MSEDVIYLDYNASTPCDPRVVQAMLPYLTDVFANPSSRSHGPGREAFSALEGARETTRRLLGARSVTEIVFTSGATEGNNLALIGTARALENRGRHIITQATEHPSVLQPLMSLQRDGWEITTLGVDGDGCIQLEKLASAIRDDTVLVSLMLANNETGTLQPVREAAAMIHERGALLHCDAAQGIGKVDVNVADLGVDMLTVSGHKFYAPNGVGAVYLRRSKPPLRRPPLIHGGGHEGNLRSGTPNVAGAVALARALEIAAEERETESERVSALRDELEASIVSALEGCTVNGSPANRLPGTTNLSFSGIEGNALLASLQNLALSSGSACTSGHSDASPVLLAMGVAKNLARASLRLSLGRFTTASEIDRAGRRIIDEVQRLRGITRRP